MTGIWVSLSGLVNTPAVVTWNGNFAINDSALSSSVTSLARVAGEYVGVSNMHGGVSSAASSNVSASSLTGSPTLTISQASLTGAIANQSKVYGADDPTLAGIGVTLTGLVNNPAVVTWNGNVAINVSALHVSVVRLARVAGENVGVRNITGGVFSAASANYSAPSLTGSPTLTISQASLTGAIANQKIGRASGRERVEGVGGAVSVKKKKKGGGGVGG